MSDLNVAVIGLGFGAVHARVFGEMEGVRLAAICDADQPRLMSVARGRNVGVYVDYVTMLKAESLDAVVVAVPARLHEKIALDVIAAGMPVLVEKPLAPTLAEGRRLAQAAAAAGVPLTAGHIERFNPAVQELRRRMAAGEAGRVLQLTARRLGPFAARTRDVSVVHDLAFHDIDVMRYVLGAEVQSVFAHTQTAVRTDFDDALTGLMHFDNGAVGTLDVNWLTPRKVRELTVLGEHGLFVLDYLDQTLDFYESDPGESAAAAGRAWGALQTLRGSGPGPVVRIPIEPREPLERELSAFVASVRDKTPPLVNADDALAALAIADALTESARTGQPVRP